MSKAESKPVLGPPPIATAATLIDEALACAKAYFADLRRPPDWFRNRYDTLHWKRLADLAKALLDDAEPVRTLDMWLPEVDLVRAYVRCRTNLETPAAPPSPHILRDEIDELRPCLAGTSRTTLITDETIESCLDDIEALLGRGVYSRVMRGKAGVRRLHDRLTNRFRRNPRQEMVRHRAASIQAFYRLHSTLQLPPVRQHCIARILDQVRATLDARLRKDADQAHNPAVQLDSKESGAGISPTVPQPEAPAPESAPAPTTDGSTVNVSTAAVGSANTDAPKDVHVPAAAPLPEGVPPERTCLGLPFRQRGQRTWRTLCLVPNGDARDIRSTERSTIDCVPSVQRIETRPDQRPLSVTFESGYDFEDFLDLEAAYRDFKQTPKAERALDDGLGPTPPPLTPTGIPLGCGHTDCDGDLSDVDRTERVCPRCHRVILSRCGNAGCLEEHLHLDIHGEDPECPGCGRPNRNRFWTCDVHPEQGTLSTQTDPRCPTCVDQWAGDSTPQKPTRVRVGIARCPGCEARATRDTTRQPLLLPERLRDLMTAPEGIECSPNVISRCVEAGLTPDGRCPRCQAQLVPFVPEANPRSGTAQPRQNLACGSCAFPLTRGAKRCPRCRHAPEDCHVCAAGGRLDGGLSAARPPSSWFQHCDDHATCARCATVQYSLRHGPTVDALAGFVCRNVYGCPIGGALASTSRLVLIQHQDDACPVCAAPDLAPLDWRAFRAELRRCAFCSVSLGDPVRWSRGRLLASLASTPDEGATALGEQHAQTASCRLCARRGIDEAMGPSDIERAALELAKALWVGKTDRDARDWLRHAGRIFGQVEPRQVESHLLTQTQTPARLLLRRRLERLLPSL